MSNTVDHTCGQG